MSTANEVSSHSGKHPRPTIHVQLDVKGLEDDGGGGKGNSQVDPTPPYLRVSFSGAKRSDLSLFRAPSPASGDHQFHHLALPSARSGRGGSTVSILEDISGYGYVDERVLIKSFETLANALGFKKKSFSTNDILGIEGMYETTRLLQKSQSDMHIADLIPMSKLEANSRSLSTWVAVGDTSATTQLPSPQARLGSASPNFTPADLIRSVNKRIRQSYLRKRLLTTYKALERMSQSGFNLDRLQEVVNETELPSGLVTSRHTTRLPGRATNLARPVCKSATVPASKNEKKDSALSSREIERDRGKPLSKYERNVMIFDWLHTLDESATAEFT